MVEEIWVPVKGYEDAYEVSNTGRIRSIDRVDRNGRFRKGVELKLSMNTNPAYMNDDSWYVRLSRNGKTRSLDFNRIYGRTFNQKLPLPPPIKKKY